MFSFIYDHPLIERPVKISYLYEYHAYWYLHHDERLRNPHFNSIDGLFLDLKQNSPKAIDFFYNKLLDIFNCFENIDDINFTTIPPHVANLNQSPMHIITQKLALQYNKFDYSKTLQRFKTIPRLSDGGIRNIGIHINSIKINPNYKIKGQNFILLDDITTSGSSMAAAAQILYIGGAHNVTCLALSHKD